MPWNRPGEDGNFEIMPMSEELKGSDDGATSDDLRTMAINQA